MAQAQAEPTNPAPVPTANASTESASNPGKTPTLATAQEAKQVFLADPAKQQLEAKVRRLEGQNAKSLTAANDTTPPVLKAVLQTGSQAPALIDQLGTEGQAAFQRLQASGDPDPHTNPEAATDWDTVLRAGRNNLRPGGPWAGNEDLRKGVEAVDLTLADARPPQVGLQDILRGGRQAPPQLIDQLGPEGAAAFRRLTDGEKTNFADKQTASDWLTVAKAGNVAVTTGPWKGSIAAQRLVEDVKAQVVSGLADRGKNQPPYRSPSTEQAIDAYPDKGWIQRMKERVDEDRKKGVDPQETAKYTGFIISALQGGVGTTPAQKQALFAYVMAADRDSPTTQARLELTANKDNPAALDALTQDVDFPSLFQPVLGLSANPLGPASLSTIPAGPTIDQTFRFSNEPGHTFTPLQQEAVTRAIETFRIQDPTGWANLNKAVATNGPIEIQNSEGAGSQAGFNQQNGLLLQIDYGEIDNVLFRLKDGSVSRFSLDQVLWHELSHFGQLGEYGIDSISDLSNSVGTLQLTELFENEATFRANEIHRQQGLPERAGVLQNEDIRDFGGGQAGFDAALASLLKEPPKLDYGGHDWANYTQSPQVLYNDGNSSLVLYPGVDFGATPAGGVGTLVISS